MTGEVVRSSDHLSGMIQTFVVVRAWRASGLVTARDTRSARIEARV